MVDLEFLTQFLHFLDFELGSLSHGNLLRHYESIDNVFP